MPHLREEADADRIENYVAMTDHKTEQNLYELFCASCGRVMYVDGETKEQFNRAMQHDLDNQFVCDKCQQEQDEMAYATH